MVSKKKHPPLTLPQLISFFSTHFEPQFQALRSDLDRSIQFNQQHFDSIYKKLDILIDEYRVINYQLKQMDSH